MKGKGGYIYADVLVTLVLIMIMSVSLASGLMIVQKRIIADERDITEFINSENSRIRDNKPSLQEI